jgi:RNA polymerase sigma-70 factor (ECF subfamily)
VAQRHDAEDDGPELAPATLGDVLYPDPSKAQAPEHDWVRLVELVAGGDQLALHALYERAHRLVFTLSMRITGSRETAEELTIDVFHDVWRRAGSYDAANGTVLGWIMNQTRSRAIDRVRFDHRKKRMGVAANESENEAPEGSDADCTGAIELRQQREELLRALDVLTPGERQAIEAAFFSELTYAEVAVRLHEPLGTVKTRIRSALHKLREALGGGGTKP